MQTRAKNIIQSQTWSFKEQGTVDLAQKTTLLSKLRGQFAEGRALWREAGFKGVVRKYGWKFFALFFVYYLIRDLTIYILVPYLIAQKIF